MTEAVETPAAPPEAPPEPEQVVFGTLKEAVNHPSFTQDTRVYRITTGQGAVKRTKHVVAVSPAAAALAVVGKDNVELVSPKEKHNAALEALADARQKSILEDDK